MKKAEVVKALGEKYFTRIQVEGMATPCVGCAGDSDKLLCSALPQCSYIDPDQNIVNLIFTELPEPGTLITCEGKDYLVENPSGSQYCDGCVAERDEALCTNLPNCGSPNNGILVIFKEYK